MADEKTFGNMVIAQSGGPTMVINQSLVGAVLEAKKHKQIKGIYGARHGIKGVLREDFIDLRKERPATLEQVANTPSSALGSVRKKPTPEECAQIFLVLRRYDVRYFFYIGGNDSAETAYILHEQALRDHYDLTCFHICKTIDNDLLENDHTPGFGSAARFVALAFMGDNLDNRALLGVKINVIMGRHAGFLTASAALARQYPDDGPHLIYLPERPFDADQFVKDVKAVYEKLGRCVVAVAEGVSDAKGASIAASFTNEVDAHGNKQLSGTGALGDCLADLIRAGSGISRIRADTFGYLQRSFAGLVSPTDAREARASAMFAVKTAVQNISGSVAIRRRPGKRYDVRYECVPLASVAKETRHMPDEFIGPAGNDVTRTFIEYARPLVGPLPKMGRLRCIPVKKAVLEHLPIA